MPNSANISSNAGSVVIYTDGASLGNPGPGGYGAVIMDGDNRTELCDGFRKTTNNRMEYLGAVMALKALGDNRRSVELYTDSRLLVDTMTKGWVQGWQKRGWKKSDNTPVLNVDLIKELLVLTAKHNVKFNWVKGHAGIPENERCDVLSKDGAAIGASNPDKIDYAYEGKSGPSLFDSPAIASSSKTVSSKATEKTTKPKTVKKKDDVAVLLENIVYNLEIKKAGDKYRMEIVDKEAPTRKMIFEIPDEIDFLEKITNFIK